MLNLSVFGIEKYVIREQFCITDIIAQWQKRPSFSFKRCSGELIENINYICYKLLPAGHKTYKPKWYYSRIHPYIRCKLQWMLIGLQIDLWSTIIIFWLIKDSKINNWLVCSHKFYSLFIHHTQHKLLLERNGSSSCWRFKDNNKTDNDDMHIAILSSYMKIFFSFAFT